MRNLLPIGSVVRLDGATKRLMVVGRAQRDQDGNYHDYSGCLYPEGYIGADDMYLFDHADIDVVFAMGYQDDAEFALREHLGEKLLERGIS